MPDTNPPQKQSQPSCIVKKAFNFMLLCRKTTGQRLCVVFLVSLAGIGLMIFMLWLEGKIHSGGKFNFDLIKTIHIFVLSVPVAAVLWVFTLSERYARQNYFFIGTDVCNNKVREFFIRHGRDAREQDYFLPIYKDFENPE